MDKTNAGAAVRKILTEWHEFPLPELVGRDVNWRTFEEGRLVTVVGPRRAGKTWVCYELMQRLLDSGVPRGNILFINLEDERLHPMAGGELSSLLEVQEELYPASSAHPRYCLVDEVHNAPDWSHWARRVVEQNQDLRLVLTGSSSRLLSSEIATELRGRARSITILPYSFREFTRLRSQETDHAPDLVHSRRAPAMRRLFTEYLDCGGFPDAINHSDRLEVLQEYYRAMFRRDMVERFHVQNTALFDAYLKLQLSRFAALTSLSSLETELKEMGYSLSRTTLGEYLSHARDVFLLFDVLKYTPSQRRQMRAPRKVYCVDQGLLNAVRFSVTEDRGRLLENLVFLQLRRHHTEGIYYHSESYECDFVLQSRQNPVEIVQACWDLSSERTRARELAGLVEAARAYSLDRGTIVTSSESEQLVHEGVSVNVRPYWEWALSYEH